MGLNASPAVLFDPEDESFWGERTVFRKKAGTQSLVSKKPGKSQSSVVS
jgi:hypothetical protein